MSVSFSNNSAFQNVRSESSKCLAEARRPNEASGMNEEMQGLINQLGQMIQKDMMSNLRKMMESDSRCHKHGGENGGKGKVGGDMGTMQLDMMMMMLMQMLQQMQKSSGGHRHHKAGGIEQELMMLMQMLQQMQQGGGMPPMQMDMMMMLLMQMLQQMQKGGGQHKAGGMDQEMMMLLMQMLQQMQAGGAGGGGEGGRPKKAGGGMDQDMMMMMMQMLQQMQEGGGGGKGIAGGRGGHPHPGLSDGLPPQPTMASVSKSA